MSAVQKQRLIWRSHLIYPFFTATVVCYPASSLSLHFFSPRFTARYFSEYSRDFAANKVFFVHTRSLLLPFLLTGFILGTLTCGCFATVSICLASASLAGFRRTPHTP